MDGFLLIVVNGLALGLASTLHCAGMCGAISCSLFLAQQPGSRREAQTAFALTHLGRIAAYAAAGALIGSIGAPTIAWLDREAAFRLLQWAAAASLIWIGLSTAGLVPSLTLLDRSFASVSAGIGRMRVDAAPRHALPLVAGVAWGMMPCAMVYAALFTAMLTGSGSGGAVSMAAFGIGTLPGLIAATFGFRRLTATARGGLGRVAAGFAIALFGVATVFIAHPAAALFCLTGTPPEHVSPRVNRTVARLDRGQAPLAARALALDPAPAVSGTRLNP